MSAVTGQMEQKIRSKLRLHFSMSADDWLQAYGTGHLNDLKAMGAKWHSQYLEERAALDYGYGFKVIPKSSVRAGPLISESDSGGHTTLVQNIYRLNLRDIFGDTYKPVYLEIENPDSKREEGLGIVIEHAQKPFWIPDDHMVVAMTTAYSPQKQDWLAPVNPG